MYIYIYIYQLYIYIYHACSCPMAILFCSLHRQWQSDGKTHRHIYIYIIKYTYTHIYTRHGHRYNFLLFNTIAFTTKIGVCLLCLWFYIFSCSCLSAAWNIDECMHVTATNARNHLTSHELRKPKSMYGCRGP